MLTINRPMMIPTREQMEEGETLLVHKPKGWTSFDVVNKIRYTFRVQKVGHAGTLDPMATGLLVVCTGKKTKGIDQYVGLEKEYNVRMILGARTESYDAETPVIARRTTEDVTEEMVNDTLASFVGLQVQLPPMWSAVKVGGKRLYKYARKGKEVERRPREVFVKSIRVLEVSIPEVSFNIVCGKGTYVRTLVDDVGTRIGCGAYMTALERVRLGEFLLSDAITIEELVEHRNQTSREV